MTAARPRDILDLAPVREEAHLQAREATVRAGVQVTLVTDLAELEDVEALINETWRNPTSEISLGMLRALSKSDNLVSGAYHRGMLVGACIAFLSGGEHPHLHSHLAAVRPQERARGIGFTLKLHQRAWALDRGITSVTWTFDPLVRRNARLNLARLGARPVEYLRDFYGTRDDAFNASVPTDRILVTWPLADPRTRLACARATTPMHADDLTAGGGQIVVSAGRWGEPVTAEDLGTATVLVGLPEDITGLRRDRPEVAEQWRLAVRQSMGRALDEGMCVVGFTEEGHYVLDRGPAQARSTNGLAR